MAFFPFSFFVTNYKFTQNMVFFMFCIGTMFACNSETSSANSMNLVETNMSQFGIPITLSLPKSAIIKESNYSYEKGLLISGDVFDMRIDAFELLADTSHDANLIKANVLLEKKTENDFKRIIIDEPTGFVYETVDDELGSNYHFFFVKVQEKLQIEFREGIPKKENYSLESIINMYEAVKNQKKM